MKFDDKQITNASFRRYRVPHFRDAPKIETVLVDRPDLTSVGAGETPIIVVAPAIANAVFHATGERIRQMPMRFDVVTYSSRPRSAPGQARRLTERQSLQQSRNAAR